MPDKISITRPFVSWYTKGVYIIDPSRQASVQVCQFIDCDNADGKTWLCNVFTEPSHRGAGLATRLIECAKRYCQRQGITSLYLWCTHAMIPFYKTCGFETINRPKPDSRGNLQYTMVCTIPHAKPHPYDKKH